MINRKHIALALVAVFGVVGFSSAAFAQQQDTLRLAGQMSSVLELVVTPTAAATSLSLDETARNIKVADVFYRANVSGFSLTFESANAGRLVHTGGEDAVGYVLGFEGQSMDLANAFTAQYVRRTGAVGVSSDLDISYAETWSAPGSYSDIVTVTLAATN